MCCPLPGMVSHDSSCSAALMAGPPFLILKNLKIKKTQKITQKFEVLKDTEDAPEHWEM